MYGLVQVATKVGIVLELGDTNLMNIIQKRETLLLLLLSTM